MSEFVIDKGISIPVATMGARRTGVWWQMEVGDSFFIAGSKNNPNGRVQACVKATGWKFVSRTWEQDGVKGFRVWRVS
ncbi:MAG: hypothetical protein KGL39_19325 [Patescibacteria group bacterium]|nr:hypothetical protein [Patescibacteria group bacterium]